MICKNHNLSIEAVCQKCKTFVCIQCMLETHNQHLSSISLNKNIILTIHNIISILEELEIFFSENIPESQTVLKFIEENKYLYKKELWKILLQNQVCFSLQFFIGVVEKQVLKQINSLRIFNNIVIGKEQKQTLNQLVQNKIKQENQISKKIQSYDIYYLLLKYGIEIKSTQVYEQYLLRLVKKDILFKSFLENMKREKKDYKQFVQDEHFKICLGRNYYLIGQYEKCIAYMEGFEQNEEAKIYIALSNLFLKKEEVAIAQFYQLKLLPKYKDLMLFFQGYALELIGNEKEAVAEYEILYQQHPNQMLLISICSYLDEKDQDEKLLEICNQSIDKDPENYFAWAYKGINCFRAFNYGNDKKSIADYLVQLDPSGLSGYILKGASLIQESQFEKSHQIWQFLKKKFPNDLVGNLMESFNLFCQQKYEESYDLFKDIPVKIFKNNLDKLFIEIIILMKFLDLPEARKKLFQNYQDSETFYLICNEFCDQVELAGIPHQVIFLMKGFKNEIQNNQLGFYHILKGRLLFSHGRKVKKIEFIEKSLQHFTDYQHDSHGLPYAKYYLGEALLNLNRINEAMQQFEEALNCPSGFKIVPYNLFEYIVMCKFMLGQFDQVLKYQQDAENQYKEIKYDLNHKVFLGVSLFAKGQNEQAYVLLNQFLLSWILKEQNKYQQAEQLLCQLNQQFPQLQLFIQKYTFLSAGPYSSYIQNNQEKFNTYDNKIFYAIKFVAFYFEVEGHILPVKYYQMSLASALIIALRQHIHQSNFQLQTELLKSYPFV